VFRQRRANHRDNPDKIEDSPDIIFTSLEVLTALKKAYPSRFDLLKDAPSIYVKPGLDSTDIFTIEVRRSD
jgi:hypothetical protein